MSAATDPGRETDALPPWWRLGGLPKGFRDVLQADFDARLFPICVAMAVLYGTLTFFHPWMVDPPRVGQWLTVISLVSAAVCLGLAFFLGRQSNAGGWGVWVGLILAGILCLNSGLHLYWTQEALQSTNFVIVMLGAGSVYTRFRWWLVSVALVWSAWLVSGPLAFDYANWAHFGFMLLMMTLMSFVLLMFRVRHRIRLEKSHRALHEKAASLERSNQALRTSEARFTEAQRIARIGSWEYDDTQKRFWASSEAYGILGFSSNEPDAPLVQLESLILEGDRERCHRQLQEVLRLGGDFECEFRVRLGSDERVLFVRGSGEMEDPGRGVYLRGTLQDYTDRRHGESEHAKLEAQFRQAQKMDALGLLAGGIAHDFNNILFSIMGNAQLAEMDVPEGHAAKKSLANIISASKRARDVVRQILTFSQGQDLDVAPTEVSEMVSEVLDLIRASLPPMIEIRTEMEPDCPLIAADKSQLHQILINLCSNALDAMKQDGGILTLSVRSQTLDQMLLKRFPELDARTYVCLSVRDTGRGIEASDLERIFEPFFTTRANDGGVGLGLAVVHGIVKRHGGAIAAHSRPGQGACFEMFFPVSDPVAPVASEAVEPYVRGQGERILLVDDEVAVGQAVAELLERLDYQVTLCTNPLDCEELLNQFPKRFDLVMTDQWMREIVGTELIRRIRNRLPALPVVLISGRASDIGEDELRQLDVACLLEKPVLLDALASAIAGALKRRGDGNGFFPLEPDS